MVSHRLRLKKTLQVVLEIANAAGPLGMVGGQSADIKEEGTIQEQDALAMLQYIHTHKTAALFRVATRVGAIIADAAPKAVSSFNFIRGEAWLGFSNL